MRKAAARREKTRGDFVRQQAGNGAELLADEIAQKIKNKIQYQEYQPGERLTVRRLCEEYGTSETPVKQALNQLVTTGLVVSVPKCGMRVRTFNFQDMKNIWEARMMIEQFCAHSAVERARRDEDYISWIQDILRVSNAEHEKCIQDYNKENFTRLQQHDRLLHLELVKCCGNDQILDIYNGLNAHSGMFIGFRFHTPDTLRGVCRQHTEIVDQLLLCDEEGLKRAIGQHIYSTIQIYRAGMVRKE